MPSKLFKKSLAARSPESIAFIRKYLDFLERLETARVAKGITTQQLADALQISIETWLSGDYPLTLKNIVKLETVLKTELITIPTATVEIMSFPNKLKIAYRNPPLREVPIDTEWSVRIQPSQDASDLAIAL